MGDEENTQDVTQTKTTEVTSPDGDTTVEVKTDSSDED